MDDEIVTLLSSDHQEFKVKRIVAEKSEAIRCILAETSIESPVPLPNVRAKVLEKVVEFCQFDVDANTKDGEKSSKSAEDVRSPAGLVCIAQVMDVGVAGNATRAMLSTTHHTRATEPC